MKKHPRLCQRFQIKEKTAKVADYLAGENRFRQLNKLNPERQRQLRRRVLEVAKERFTLLTLIAVAERLFRSALAHLDAPRIGVSNETIRFPRRMERQGIALWDQCRLTNMLNTTQHSCL